MKSGLSKLRGILNANFQDNWLPGKVREIHSVNASLYHLCYLSPVQLLKNSNLQAGSLVTFDLGKKIISDRPFKTF